MFTLLVCADLYGQKINLEVPFPSVPTINELTRVIEQVYGQEAQQLKPQGFPAIQFQVSRIQIYDDSFLKWVDLISSTQLHEYDQLYVFQPQSAWHVDLQKDLPAPRPPTGVVPPYAGATPSQMQQSYAQPGSPPPAGYSPVPQHGGSQYASAAMAPVAGPQPVPAHYGSPAPQSASPFGQPYPGGGVLPQPMGAALAARERQNIPKEQKVQAVFRELDQQQKGWIDTAEFERGFRSRGVDFSSKTVEELFAKGDFNRDGRLDWQEWCAWCELYPNTLEVVYYRGRDTTDEEQLRSQRAQVGEALERARQREADLRRQLDDCSREQQQLQQQLADLDTRGQEATSRRHLLEQQERDLLEQEIKLERQKDQLRLSQQRFQEVAFHFDSEAYRVGSPRRARQDGPAAQPSPQYH
eukprot:TRINITY_DN3110_c1_g1_i1.p1 TRINITY_DN3110_c1_g1~~TRINITY_DN3110_c1_g1_i1.p1  ORF type:complete len:412 (+),score=116.59 TRINITY_DN3110_c1_g1_i1:103-1338(+)